MAITLPPWGEPCELVMRVSEDIEFSRVKQIISWIEMECIKIKEAAKAAEAEKKKQKENNKKKNKNKDQENKDEENKDQED